MKGSLKEFDITPDSKVYLNGYILRFGRSKGVHDKILGRLFLLESKKGEKFLFGNFDILTISDELSSELRCLIEKNFKIPQKNIFLSAIHTHSSIGGPYIRAVGSENKKWVKDFKRKILYSTEKLFKNLSDIELLLYKGESKIGYNRRKKEKGIDENLLAVVIEGLDRESIFLNYGCHPVALTEKNLYISSDFLFFTRKFLEKKLMMNLSLFFFNGGSGDVDPIFRGGFKEAKKIGYILGEDIIKAISKNKETVVGEPERVYEKDFLIEYKLPFRTPEEWEENYKKHLKEYKSSKTKEERKIKKAFLLWAEEMLYKAKEGKIKTSKSVKISLLKFENLLFLFAPFEIFSSISKKIRAFSNPYEIFVVSYTNGYSGYMPDKEAFFEGGYEVSEWHKYAGELPLKEEVPERFLEMVEEMILEAKNG